MRNVSHCRGGPGWGRADRQNAGAGLAALVGLVLALSACQSSRSATLSAVDWERAEAATARGDWERAAAHWNHIRAREGVPTARAYVATAEAMQHLGRADDALALLDRGLVLFPEDPSLLLVRARLQRELGFRRAAERDAATAVSRAPDRLDGWTLLAFLRLELESPTRAAEACEQALRLAPDDPEVQVLAARAWRGVGNVERAHQHYARALATDGQRTYDLLLEAASLHAVAGVRTTPVDAAVGWVEEALVRHPQCPRAAFVQGCLLERAGASDRAIAAYRRAIEIDNFHLPALTNLALLYHGQGEAALAQEMVERILVLDLERDPARRRALRELLPALTDETPGS